MSFGGGSAPPPPTPPPPPPATPVYGSQQAPKRPSTAMTGYMSPAVPGTLLGQMQPGAGQTTQKTLIGQ